MQPRMAYSATHGYVRGARRPSGRLYSLAAEPADIGHDSYSPVTDDYDPWDNRFTGTIHKVTVKHKEHQTR